MIKNFNNIKLLTLLSLLAVFCACGTTGSKDNPDDVKTDLTEVELQADAAYDSGNYVESEKHYTLLVEQLPEESLFWFRLGNIYVYTQRPDAAIIAYREALIRNPKYSKAWYNMGIIQLKQAVNSFNEMQIHTDNEDPLNQQAKHLLEGIINLVDKDKPEQ